MNYLDIWTLDIDTLKSVAKSHGYDVSSNEDTLRSDLEQNSMDLETIRLLNLPMNNNSNIENSDLFIYLKEHLDKFIYLVVRNTFEHFQMPQNEDDRDDIISWCTQFLPNNSEISREKILDLIGNDQNVFPDYYFDLKK
jgi:hypothetical protein